MTNYYGPYGNPGGLPPLTGGIDDADSLRLAGILPDFLTGGWYPQIIPGRYTVSSEPGFRYLFARPQEVALSLAAGRLVLPVVLPAAGYSQECLAEAPLVVRTGAGLALTPVSQNVRFGYPVYAGNTTIAADLVDNALLGASGNSVLSSGDSLWWQPLFGADVLLVHRSRNARSTDVLSDPDSQLHEVTSPDQFFDDRSYYVDREQGLVFGRFPAQTLPPPPFGSGAYAQTYLTLSYPTESDPTLESSGISLSGNTYWASYWETRASYYAAYEGGSGSSTNYYDPLRLEEIGVVDRDGLIRTRRAIANTSPYLPSVVVLTPDGPINCTTQYISNNLLDACVADPTQDNALVRLPYGTTVIVRYWTFNSFAVVALTEYDGAPPQRVVVNLAVLCGAGTPSGGSLLYESEPGTVTTPHTFGNIAPDLNPLTTPNRSGFLWLQDANNPPSLPAASSGLLGCGVTRPQYVSGEGEVFTVEAQAIDLTGTPISGISLKLVPTSGDSTVTPSVSVAGQDGIARFRVTWASADVVTGDSTLTLYDTRNLTKPLDTLHLLSSHPSGTDTFGLTPTWEPTLIVSLGETYQVVTTSNATLSRRYVRVSILQPDGFPWGFLQSVSGAITPPGGTLVLTSASSVFHDPTSGSDTVLGNQVVVPYTPGSTLLDPSGLLTVGYVPVPGDTLIAQVYLGEDTYLSNPTLVS